MKADYPQVNIKTEDARTGQWKHAEYYYKNSHEPVVLECNKNTSSTSLCVEECEEFIEKIGSPGLSLVKRKVIRHLKKTHYIISCQLLNDIDENGYHLNGELLNIFVSRYEGIIQADSEGFYDGYKISVVIK